MPLHTTDGYSSFSTTDNHKAMALPLDNDVFVNVLREISLAATVQLANTLSSTNANVNASDGAQQFNNLQSPSLFGRLYREKEISRKLDIHTNFPLLSKLPQGSPPIKFIATPSTNSSAHRRIIHASSASTNAVTEESDIEDDDEDEDYDDEEDEDDDDDEEVEDEDEDEYITDGDDHESLNPKKLNFYPSNDLISFKDTSSRITSNRLRQNSSVSTLSSNLQLNRRPRSSLSYSHRRTPSSISAITITETEDESHDEHESAHIKQNNSLDVASSPELLQGRIENMTPVRRPELGERTTSLNTLKTPKTFDLENTLNIPDTPISAKSSLLKSPSSISTSTATKTNTHSSSKKQSKGLRSLGRFIRPKQLTSTFTHHSTNSTVTNASSTRSHNDSLDNDSHSQEHSDSALISKPSKEMHNHTQSENFLLDNVDHHKPSSTKTVNSAKSHSKSDAVSTISGSKSKMTFGSDSNSERDTIDSSDFEDNDSVVDSIESSELADSDYDYFNPPATADATRLEKRTTRGSVVPGEHLGNISDSALNTEMIDDLGTSSGSILRRASRGMYHSFEDPDVGDYIDDLDSDDYISDAEDYPIDDSIGYFNHDTISSNSIVGGRKRLSTSFTSSSSDIKARLDLLHSTGGNSISQINFVRSRPALKSTNSTNSMNTVSRRRQSLASGMIKPSALIMSDTGEHNQNHFTQGQSHHHRYSLHTGSLSTSAATTFSIKSHVKPGVKSTKSYNNLFTLTVDMENKEKEREKEKEKSRGTLSFAKIEIKKANASQTEENNNKTFSRLSELINKKNISLDYYKYVPEKQNINDRIVNLHICSPDLKIPYSDSLSFQVNASVQVVELIGYILYQLQKNKNENLGKHHLEPNYWKLYLADDDGEIEDDFGVLDRTRTVESYGADEFVLVECSDFEKEQNEKITPSPLGEQNLSSVNLTTNNNDIPASTMMGSHNLTFGSTTDRNDSVTTIPVDLTPISGLTFTNTLPSNNLQQQKKQQQQQQKLQQQQLLQRQQQQGRFFLDDLDSDEDDNFNSSLQDKKQVRKDIKKYAYLKSKLNTGSAKVVGFNDKKDEKESKLNKFKTRSKTIQSILHNTADHYQQTQQELFRVGTTNNNNLKNNMTFGSLMDIGNMNGVDVKSSTNNGIIGGAGNASFIDNSKINSSMMSYKANRKGKNNQQTNTIFLDDMNEGDNKALMYHRWTVWRRQQMSFKNKLPKTLTVDGYQIYLLPFNEFKGSWYESKTYNFDISQILKIKQNPKVPNYFKIIIKKNAEGIVKKYYLEARNAKECKEIVDTIKVLAKTYSEQM